MKESLRLEWIEDCLAGFACYYLTSTPVLVGVLFATDVLSPLSSAQRADPIAACVTFDAIHYLDILDHGYFYDPAAGSSVAWFPAYPLIGRWVKQITGLSSAEAALLVANLAFLAACVLFACYARTRWPEATAAQRSLGLAVFGLWPMGLFFRMPYPESLFVCCTLLVLYGMNCSWPMGVLAVLAGLTTAIRPVGVAMTAGFVWYILSSTRLRWRARIVRVILMAPCAAWGLLVYMGYQWYTFGTPLAFSQTQQNWTFLAPEDCTWPVKLMSLATFEPIWSVYVPGHRRYWGNVGNVDPLFNLHFWNPIFFVLAGTLLLIGRLKWWLTGSEFVLGTGLLAIPFATRSFEMSMASHGRFAAVVVVDYLVIARLLAKLPPLAIVGICSGLVLFLCVFTTLYAAHLRVF